MPLNQRVNFQHIKSFRFATLDQFKLYFGIQKGKMSKVFAKGKKRLEEELDAVRILKTLRYLRILLKNGVENDLEKALMITKGKSVINIDSEEV